MPLAKGVHNNPEVIEVDRTFLKLTLVILGSVHRCFKSHVFHYVSILPIYIHCTIFFVESGKVLAKNPRGDKPHEVEYSKAPNGPPEGEETTWWLGVAVETLCFLEIRIYK